jgi:hypothetical protein
MLRLLLALLLAILIATPGDAQVRKNANDLTSAEVQSLRRGFAVMLQRNDAPRNSADWRRSLQFWANVHGHFGAGCDGPVTGAGMAGVRTWTAGNAAEDATWCRCVHRTDQFLTWHRMFTYYFERVLQQAAGDPNLRLPYWNYQGPLPAIYRARTYVNANGRTVPNPLFVEARRLNTGGTLAASVVSVANAMRATDYTTFRSRIETAPHGTIHCAMTPNGCPNGLMGSVATAALDPVFWLHHSNIDRLYQCWLGQGPGRLPTAPAVVNARYSFVDRDGTVQTRRAGDMLRTSQLGGYRYAPDPTCNAPAATMAAASLERSGPTLEPMYLVRVPKGASTLRLDGLIFDPGAMFEVWVIGPEGQANVGVISAFGDRDNDHGSSPDFDIASALAAVGVAPGGEVGVTLVPTDGIGRISAPVPAFVATVE